MQCGCLAACGVVCGGRRGCLAVRGSCVVGHRAESRALPSWVTSGRRPPYRYESMQRARKLVEYRRWRYRDAKTGRLVRTLFQLTEAEAARCRKRKEFEGSAMSRRSPVDDESRLQTICSRSALTSERRLLPKPAVRVARDLRPQQSEAAIIRRSCQGTRRRSGGSPASGSFCRRERGLPTRSRRTPT